MLALILKGYRIAAWRYRTPRGEIDIVARKKNLIVFVEVKARATILHGMEAVSFTSQKRIENAGADYIQSRSNRTTLSHRFDLMIVARGRQNWWPLHVINAW